MPQPAATKAGLDALLTPKDSVLILIDHQPFQFANLHSHEPTMVVNNVIGLAKTAKIFDVPTILTTVLEARGGYLIKGLQDVFPDQKPIDRTFINTWEDDPCRRGREEDRPQEADHGRALDGNLLGHARDPGGWRRLRGVCGHRRLGRGDQPRPTRWPSAAWSRRESHRSPGWQSAASCSATGRANPRAMRSARFSPRMAAAAASRLPGRCSCSAPKAARDAICSRPDTGHLTRINGQDRLPKGAAGEGVLNARPGGSRWGAFTDFAADDPT